MIYLSREREADTMRLENKDLLGHLRKNRCSRLPSRLSSKAFLVCSSMVKNIPCT